MRSVDEAEVERRPLLKISGKALGLSLKVTVAISNIISGNKWFEKELGVMSSEHLPVNQQVAFWRYLGYNMG
ncbi:hypothetical protein UY3_15635 [Chelonia mydas]|uniref:Uncharacterized protein n=1 Tax=Chelonia mydas TaxID=8469 RepID=M7AW61_CHEMY|nr:hypothetical protein UY3_15635 [Chelonia mydas]